MSIRIATSLATPPLGSAGRSAKKVTDYRTEQPERLRGLLTVVAGNDQHGCGNYHYRNRAVLDNVVTSRGRGAPQQD
jgi:hypothetical protein